MKLKEKNIKSMTRDTFLTFTVPIKAPTPKDLWDSPQLGKRGISYLSV